MAVTPVPCNERHPSHLRLSNSNGRRKDLEGQEMSRGVAASFCTGGTASKNPSAAPVQLTLVIDDGAVEPSTSKTIFGRTQPILQPGLAVFEGRITDARGRLVPAAGSGGPSEYGLLFDLRKREWVSKTLNEERRERATVPEDLQQWVHVSPG
ncbi:hypothetical protein GALMADRAFT_214572 [Galerina marginata CBS 339.88]|uniref:Uncharacterized protein n=1 Tax=Galerina marginata (strain CBS 339.88) TaxID=685588 RepID=A0A067SI01_GALM3|nr:hypothetical protein GALMADRAFT_214572 [Galerina marginata CBS 339.88]